MPEARSKRQRQVKKGLTDVFEFKAERGKNHPELSSQGGTQQGVQSTKKSKEEKKQQSKKVTETVEK